MIVMANGFDDEFGTQSVAGWRGGTRHIQVSKLPFDLHLTSGPEPALVDLTEACGSAEPLFLRLLPATTVRFREKGIEVRSPHFQNPMILRATVRLGTEIIIGPEAIAPGTLLTCSHGFSPPALCPEYPHQ
ncbi:hypothetical protein [Arthrobacter sp. HLT1-20]